MEEGKVKKIIREGYGNIAKKGICSCCGPNSSSKDPDFQENLSKKIGYSNEELSSVPEGADLGLGCGNPVAIASLKEGETVLDLGSECSEKALQKRGVPPR